MEKIDADQMLKRWNNTLANAISFISVHVHWLWVLFQLQTYQSCYLPKPGLHLFSLHQKNHRNHYQPSLLLKSNNYAIESRTLSIRRGDAAVTETSFHHNYTLAPAVLGPRDNRARRLTITQLTRAVQVTTLENVYGNFHLNIINIYAVSLT